MSAQRSSMMAFKHSVARGVCLVDFNASWCQPCRKQASIIKSLAKHFNAVVRIKMLDIDLHQELALKLGIQSIPTILIYRDGQEINRFIGLQSGQVLDRALQMAVQSSRQGHRRKQPQGDSTHGKMHQPPGS